MHSSSLCAIIDDCVIVGDIGFEVALSGDGIISLGAKGSKLLSPGSDSIFFLSGFVVLFGLDTGS